MFGYIKEFTVVFLVLMHGVLGLIADGFLKELRLNPYITSLLSVVSGSFIVAILYVLYNKKAWRYMLFSTSMVRLPENFEGKLVSSYDENKELRVKVFITQTASNISIQQHTYHNEEKYTISESETISIKENNMLVEIVYTYVNHGDPIDQLYLHRGTCSLRYDKRTKKMVGNYYTSNERKTFGRISLSPVIKNGKLR